MSKRNKSNRSNKQRYRIFVQSIDCLIADIWAADDEEASQLALEYDGGNFRMMARDWEIDEVRQVWR